QLYGAEWCTELVRGAGGEASERSEVARLYGSAASTLELCALLCQSRGHPMHEQGDGGPRDRHPEPHASQMVQKVSAEAGAPGGDAEQQRKSADRRQRH